MRFLNIFNRKETCHSELVSESKTKLVILNECEESKTNKGCFANAQHDVKCLNKKVAFTLAEVLITLTILGVVAALTIPSVMRTQNEAAERTKLKKAIVDYEKLIPNMTIENNLTSIEALKNYANKDNCVKSRTYFKIKQDDTSTSSNNCIFQTSNGVWWNITDITRPVISTKGVENLSNADGENSFLLTTTYSDTARAFVVNDLSSSQLTDDEKAQLSKTLANAKIINSDISGDDNSDYDYASTLVAALNGDFNTPCSSTNCDPMNGIKEGCTSCSLVINDYIFVYTNNDMELTYKMCEDTTNTASCRGAVISIPKANGDYMNIDYLDNKFTCSTKSALSYEDPSQAKNDCETALESIGKPCTVVCSTDDYFINCPCVD